MIRCYVSGEIMWRSRPDARPTKSGILRHIIFHASLTDAGFPCAAMLEGQDARLLFFVSQGAQAPA